MKLLLINTFVVLSFATGCSSLSKKSCGGDSCAVKKMEEKKSDCKKKKCTDSCEVKKKSDSAEVKPCGGAKGTFAISDS